MYAVCVECSHKRGMGNLFRSLNMINWFESHHMEYVVLINNDKKSLSYLNTQRVPYQVVDLWDYHSDWERDIIKKYNIQTWIDDRMATDIRHAENVKACGVKLCSFDDTGSGAQLVDQNFCAMIFDNIDSLKGREIFTGVEYMVLNREILQYRKQREKKEKILITMGGSDTYGVTVKVAEAIVNLPYEFTIVTGYCFEHYDRLQEVIKGTGIEVRNTVPSLIEFFSHFDLAITGGGITSFEAGASGLPSIIIANERHEEQVGKFFEKSGCSEYLGYYKDANFEGIGGIINNIDVPSMSRRMLQLLRMDGLENTMKEIVR